VYGYGVGGRPGGTQRKAERTGVQDGMVLADYEPGLIRVWLPCTCQAAEAAFDETVIESAAKFIAHAVRRFAERLGPHGGGWKRAVAERYGRLLLREFGLR